MHIAVMPGDGIGKEVTAEAVKVLQALAGSDAKFTEAPIGAAGVAAATRADRAISVPGSAC
jgi:3-isopropylmalate dehydrogenase